MKKCILLGAVLVCCSVGELRAQSVADEIQQLVMDYEKLSELKSILSDMKKAYTIISAGYDNIKSISEGNFNLHKLFLDGLLAVSPAVKNYQKIVDIINAQEQIGKEYKAAYAQFTAAGVFNPQEMNYISSVYGNLFNQSLKNLDELTVVITANQLRMSDDERLAAIDRIDKDVQDKLTFLRFFNNNTGVQAQQRARELNDNATVRGLYGISN